MWNNCLHQGSLTHSLGISACLYVIWYQEKMYYFSQKESGHVPLLDTTVVHLITFKQSYGYFPVEGSVTTMTHRVW